MRVRRQRVAPVSGTGRPGFLAGQLNLGTDVARHERSRRSSAGCLCFAIAYEALSATVTYCRFVSFLGVKANAATIASITPIAAANAQSFQSSPNATVITMAVARPASQFTRVSAMCPEYEQQGGLHLPRAADRSSGWPVRVGAVEASRLVLDKP